MVRVGTREVLAGELRVHKRVEEEAVRRVVAGSRAHSGGPVFGTIAGGLSRLVEAVAARVVELGGQITTGAVVRDLSEVEADRIVLAVPGGKARRLLPTLRASGGVRAARALGEVEYASVGLVTLRLPPCTLPELSGFLVPEGEGLQIKAATFFTRTKIRKLPAPGNDPAQIQRVALALLDDFDLDRPIRLLGVRLELEMPC